METAAAQMDIFFLVTTIVVAVVGLLLAALLMYAIKFLRDAEIIARAIRDEMAEIVDDIDEFRREVRGKAERFSGLLGILTAISFIRKFLQNKS